jgi:putative membrane protein
MTQSNYDSSRRWVPFPVLAAVGVALVAIGVWLYANDPSALSTASPPWYGWPWFPFGWFFFIPIFFLIFFAFRWYFWGGWWWGQGAGYRWGYDASHEILRERYAKGEITKERFEQMMRDLDQPRQGGGV